MSSGTQVETDNSQNKYKRDTWPHVAVEPSGIRMVTVSPRMFQNGSNPLRRVIATRYPMLGGTQEVVTYLLFHDQGDGKTLPSWQRRSVLLDKGYLLDTKLGFQIPSNCNQWW